MDRADSPVARPRPPLPTRLLVYALRGAGLGGHDPDALERALDLPGRVRTRVRRRSTPADRRAPTSEPRDLSLQWRWSACYAPSTSMYLDQFGRVRACCQNTGHPLGRIDAAGLRAIWRGDAARTLRGELARGSFELGCEFCAWQHGEADPAGWFLRHYDRDPAGLRRDPPWPRQIEFAVSNTCNLQCVMCNGDWSSSIRTRREGRPPLPAAYPERFYDELVEFIPHLRRAAFTGGEPFLGVEPRRIMDLLVRYGRDDLVLAAVTNGTIWNDRVESVLSHLRPSITVSIDGGTAEVYERIRVGASFEEVLRNLDRFRDVVEAHRTRLDREHRDYELTHHEPRFFPRRSGWGIGLSVTHCLMVDNWETFPDFLRLAESRALDVSVNTVRFPEPHSLYHLPAADLAEIVRSLDRHTAALERDLTANRLETWHGQLAALSTRATSPTWPTALGIPPTDRPAAPTATAVPPPRRRRPPADDAAVTSP